MSYPLSWCPLQSIYWRPPCPPTRFTPRSSRFSQAVFIVCSILVRLGYFIGLSKSVPVPQTRIGWNWVFCLIPSFKLFLFHKIREWSLPPFDFDSILQCRTVSIKTLQRFAGKITSFSLSVPAAQLYAREVYRAISLANLFSRPIKEFGDLRSATTHWRFLYSCSEHLPWINKRHLVVNVTSDASQCAWGGIVYNPSGRQRQTYCSKGSPRTHQHWCSLSRFVW